MKEPIVRKIQHITVKKFIETYRKERSLLLINDSTGMKRLITQPAINRPGLALAGHFGYFAHERIQVFGNAENAYLESLQGEDRQERLRRIFSYDAMPCLVFSRNVEVPSDVIDLANEFGVCIFVSEHRTMEFSNLSTLILERLFGDMTSLHGCMVSIRGIGVLIRGKGGVGKSEITLGLVERGASLVADDMVRIRKVNSQLIASSPDLSRGYLEIRGMGIINVTNLFGLKAYSKEETINLVVNLTTIDEKPMSELERLGLDRKKETILGVDVESLNLPIAPGRDMSRLIEIAALEIYLRDCGYHMASEFNKRLHQEIARKTKLNKENNPDINE